MESFSFTRYLATKKSVDDRALNRQVWRTLAEAVPARDPLYILEVGAGIGTMAERVVEWGLVKNTAVSYTALDASPANIQAARHRLQTVPPGFDVEVTAVDLFDFAAQTTRQWDLLIAHALLDLLHIPTALPILFNLVKPGGLFYFTLNFDGSTILQPTIDPALDAHIEALYHQTMDKRVINGRLSGDSQTGRQLFGHIRASGGHVLAAGSSDWVVFAGSGGYPADEAYFLRFIIHTIQQALTGHPELNPAQFTDWIAQRFAQIETAELVYIAHQLDFVGLVNR